MNRRFVIAMGLFCAGLSAFAYSHQAAGQANAGWITLFDGKSLGRIAVHG